MKSPNSNLGQHEIERLKRLFNPSRSYWEFLAYEVNIATTEIRDKLRDKAIVEKRVAEALKILLAHFSKAEAREKAGKLVTFRDLPGGHAYDKAFRERAIQPISKDFGGEPRKLFKAGELLGGVARNYGDVSIEIQSLPGISLTYILWEEGEFPASANILFDESAKHYLPTEDLAVLGEMTTFRLQEARRSL